MDEMIAKIINEEKNAFYVFDSSVLKKRVRYLQEHLPPNVELCYAVKANPFIPKEIEYDAERFEICSPGEADICFSQNIDEDRMVISGIYKTPSFIEELVKNGFRGIITAESLTQYEQLCELSEKYSCRIKVLPRLTNGSQFGMNEADIEMIVDSIADHPRIEISGIQFFSGTQKTSLKKFKRELEYLDGFLKKLREEHAFHAAELEYGTGFPVSYFEGEDLDEEALLAGFSELVEQMEFKGEIILELGRSIAASCGKYYTRIVDIKQNKGQDYAMIDGGMHHLVYFGQYMAMKKPVFSVVGKSGTVPDRQWTICGSLCSMNDIVVKQAELPEIEIGDVICFENTGAYCMTEGISLFLSRDIPAVYITGEDGSVYRVRPSFETKELNTPKYERMF